MDTLMRLGDAPLSAPAERAARRRRTLAGAAALTAHLALFAALALTLAPAPPVENDRPVSVSLVEGFALTPVPEADSPTLETADVVVEAPPPDAVAVDPAPTEPLAVDPTLPPLNLQSDPEPVTEPFEPGPPPTALATASAGSTCGLAEGLRATLEQDAEVRASLASVPRRSRSVANAIMLWDGAWVEGEGLDDRTLGPLRRAIVEGVRTASAACRETANQGPLFIPVSGGAETVVLTLGSGVWRWSDVLHEAAGTPR